jgi:alpha-beta hydrolase superfamily lysophospholipase
MILFATSVAHAQQSSGTYTMFVGGNAVSTENYTLVTGSDHRLRAEAEISVRGGKQKTTTDISQDRPISFTAQAGETKMISATFDGPAVKLQIAGQKERQLTTKASVILENAVWHHLIFLFKQYDAQKGGRQSFTAFLPSQALDFGVQIEPVMTPSLEIDGKKVDAMRYRVMANSNLVFDVWTDSFQVPLVILIEAQGVKVVRQGSERLADMITKPATPDGYLSEEVTFRNGDLSLAGTLTLPKGGTKPYPVALIISGSGSQDRDGSVGAFNLYRQIADHLSSNGVAVLRHDDRGAGKSAMPKTPTTYRDLINDSRAAIQFLRGRSEIDPDRIVLIGHSEGGTTASIIASEDAKIAAIALLAGATLANLDQLLLEQTIYQMALERPFNPQEQEKFPEIVRWLIKQFDEAKAGRPDSTAVDLHEYLRQHLALNQAETYKRIHCPVLILQGERDALVLAHHAVAAAKALTDAGNKQVLLRIFPNLSHCFTPSPLDRNLEAEKKNQISPEALESIAKWMAEVVIRGKQTQPGKSSTCGRYTNVSSRFGWFPYNQCYSPPRRPPKAQ